MTDKPPEKIYVGNGFINNDPASCSQIFESDIEYRLAPVWHDAVKDPPKERGLYIVAIDTGTRIASSCCMWDGGWQSSKYERNLIRLWMPLPEPPKEEE